VAEVEVRCERTFRSKKGKTVSVKALIEGGKVEDVKVTGDFFVVDDEGFLKFEASLKGKDCEGLMGLKPERVLLGADEGEVIEALLSCLNCG
jgi:hypothetical protein